MHTSNETILQGVYCSVHVSLFMFECAHYSGFVDEFCNVWLHQEMVQGKKTILYYYFKMLACIWWTEGTWKLQKICPYFPCSPFFLDNFLHPCFACMFALRYSLFLLGHEQKEGIATHFIGVMFAMKGLAAQRQLTAPLPPENCCTHYFRSVSVFQCICLLLHWRYSRKIQAYLQRGVQRL